MINWAFEIEILYQCIPFIGHYFQYVRSSHLIKKKIVHLMISRKIDQKAKQNPTIFFITLESYQVMSYQ